MRHGAVQNPFAPRRASHPRPTAAASRLPAPEEVFVDWLLSLPPGASLATAARRQIALIDQSASAHPGLAGLRTLLLAVARDGSGAKPPMNL